MEGDRGIMYELLTIPNGKLRQKTEPVETITRSVKVLAEYMISQLEPLEAAGFSAPQFGELIRLIVIRVDSLTNLAIVNPEITVERGNHKAKEACRSIPNKLYFVQRPKIVKVRGLNLDGAGITIKGRGFLAQVLKHETDHLDGVLIDSIGKLVVK